MPSKNVAAYAIRNVKAVILIKANHPVETRAVQKEEVQRGMKFVETVAHETIMIGVPGFKSASFFLKK